MKDVNELPKDRHLTLLGYLIWSSTDTPEWSTTPVGPLSSLLASFIISEIYTYVKEASFKEWFPVTVQAVSDPWTAKFGTAV